MADGGKIGSSIGGRPAGVLSALRAARSLIRLATLRGYRSAEALTGTPVCMKRGFQVVLLGLAICLSGPAAFGHAFLERATPPVGSEVTPAPTALQLTYTEGVEAAFSNVAVSDANGKRVDTDSLTTQGDGRVLVVPLKALAPGTYTVEWHVTSVDTHQTQGHFSFTVKP
jgi:copper resistance protein C